jgi:hypothetical protein
MCRFLPLLTLFLLAFAPAPSPRPAKPATEVVVQVVVAGPYICPLVERHAILPPVLEELLDRDRLGFHGTTPRLVSPPTFIPELSSEVHLLTMRSLDRACRRLAQSPRMIALCGTDWEEGEAVRIRLPSLPGGQPAPTMPPSPRTARE